MSDAFTASVRWQRRSADFAYENYNRAHDVSFGSGTTIPASSAPAYKGDADRVNPEEQLVAALSSCHMLTFLAVAAKKRFVVDAYDDDAEGLLDKNAEGRLAVTRVVLRPRVVFGGDKLPGADELAALHDAAHRGCFIANSVRCEVVCEPRPA